MQLKHSTLKQPQLAIAKSKGPYELAGSGQNSTMKVRSALMSEELDLACRDQKGSLHRFRFYGKDDILYTIGDLVGKITQGQPEFNSEPALKGH